MLCQKCQATISEGEAFCPMCGAPAVPAQAPVEEVPAPQEEVTTNEVPMQEAPMQEEQVPTEAWGPVPEEPVKKPKPIGWIVAAVIAVVAIVAAVVVLFMMNGNKTGLQDTWKVSLQMSRFVDIAKEAVANEQSMEMLEQAYPGMDIETVFDMCDVEEPLTAYVTFREDNTCAIHLNLEETVDFFSAFYDRMLVFFQNGGYYQLLEAQGVSREEVDAMLESQGMDMNTLILAMSMGKSQLNAATLELALQQYGMAVENGNATLYETTYRYEEGVLSLSEFGINLPLTVNGNTLSIDGDLNEQSQQMLSTITIERAALPQ